MGANMPIPGVIALANAKGGTGKTTTAVHLGAEMASRGYDTVLIDADPQTTLSRHLGIEPHQAGPTLRDVIFRDVQVRDATVRIGPRLRVVPGSILLSKADIDLASKPAPDERLKRAMRNADWEIAIIDCPPSLGKLTLNALVASSYIVVPVDSAYYALEGLDLLHETVDEVRAYYNPEIRFLGNLLTMYEGRTIISKAVKDELYSRWPREMLNTTIRRSHELKKAAATRSLIGELEGSAADDYRSLTDELLERMELVQHAGV